MTGVAEIGIIASVVQIADVGFKLSTKLYAFAKTVSSADKAISSIFRDVELTSTVLKELGDTLEEDKASRIANDNALQTADGIVKECLEVFREIEDIFLKRTPLLRENCGEDGSNRRKKMMERLWWPYIQSKVVLLRSNLERLKSTLLLMLNVIIYARAKSERVAAPLVIADQKKLISKLNRENRQYVHKSEQMKGERQIEASDPKPGTLLESSSSEKEIRNVNADTQSKRVAGAKVSPLADDQSNRSISKRDSSRSAIPVSKREMNDTAEPISAMDDNHTEPDESLEWVTIRSSIEKVTGDDSCLASPNPSGDIVPKNLEDSGHVYIKTVAQSAESTLPKNMHLDKSTQTEILRVDNNMEASIQHTKTASTVHDLLKAGWTFPVPRKSSSRLSDRLRQLRLETEVYLKPVIPHRDGQSVSQQGHMRYSIGMKFPQIKKIFPRRSHCLEISAPLSILHPDRQDIYPPTATAGAQASSMAAADVAKAPTPRGSPDQPITFKDAVGRKFIFPFRLCCAWTSMEHLIQEAFFAVDVYSDHVRKGRYDLVGPDGAIVMKSTWEALVQPGWTVSMHMWPIEETPLPETPLPKDPGPKMKDWASGRRKSRKAKSEDKKAEDEDEVVDDLLELWTTVPLGRRS